MRVRLVSDRLQPPRRLTCRLLTGAAPPFPEYEGLYADGTWVFPISGDEPWDSFQLVLDGQTISGPFDRDNVDLTEDQVDLDDPPISYDNGWAQRLWFAEGAHDEDLWDVIVVGTGMGGGTLQYQLATEAEKLLVLGLEAGSLLFPTHVGNIPRMIYGPVPGGATSLWNLYTMFSSQPYGLLDAPQWAGREAFVLGGRSLFWGALAPRVSDAELANWPPAVRSDLTDAGDADASWYDRAEDLLSVHYRDGDLEKQAVQLMDRLFGDRDNAPAPVAMQTERSASWRVAEGIFSTSALLLEKRLASPTDDGFGPPYIHLGELVTAVEPGPAQPDATPTWQVHATRLRDGSRVTRYARAVVLCGGTIETVRIVETSTLPGLPAAAAALVGHGLTEHPMYYIHFEVPPESPYCHSRTSAKLLSTAGTSGQEWNLLLELGSDLVEGRALPFGMYREETAVTPGCVAGQLVFLGRADLGDGSVNVEDAPWLAQNASAQVLPRLSLSATPIDMPAEQPDVWAEWQSLATRLVAALGGDALPVNLTNGVGLTPQQAKQGYVAHEVGTMRMGADGVVDDDLQIHGCPGLFVCDNSVLPTSPAANPSLTLAALAMRLADHIAAVYPARPDV